MELAPSPTPDRGLAAVPLLRCDRLWGPRSPFAAPLGARWLCCILSKVQSCGLEEYKGQWVDVQADPQGGVGWGGGKL